MASYRGPAGRFVSQKDWDDFVKFQMASSINPTSLLREAAKSASDDLKKKYGRYIRAMYNNAKMAEGIEKMNKKVMKGAQAAVVEKYESSGIGKRPSYRQNDTGKLKRYADGAMEDALKSPEFTWAEGRRYGFANRTLMDEKAKQWYRLNFGAKPKGSTEPNVGELKMPRSLGGKRSEKKVSFKGYKASGRFKVPQSGIGTWSGDFRQSSQGATIRPVRANPGSRGRHALYVGTSVKQSRGRQFFQARKNGKMSRRYSVGIRGKRFLDAGALYINENYGKELGRTLTAWDRKSKLKLKGR